jgi:hypothetical protein
MSEKPGPTEPLRTAPAVARARRGASKATSKAMPGTRVFLDTEFTNFRNPRLISVGLAAEDGRVFYCELAQGWEVAHCSSFVLDTVLPLLDSSASLDCEAAGAQMLEWLASLGGALSVVSDSPTDWRLMAALLAPLAERRVALRPQLLDWPGRAMARRYQDLLAQQLNTHPRRHHALVDACALRQAVLQTEAEFRAPPPTREERHAPLAPGAGRPGDPAIPRPSTVHGDPF